MAHQYCWLSNLTRRTTLGRKVFQPFPLILNPADFIAKPLHPTRHNGIEEKCRPFPVNSTGNNPEPSVSAWRPPLPHRPSTRIHVARATSCPHGTSTHHLFDGYRPSGSSTRLLYPELRSPPVGQTHRLRPLLPMHLNVPANQGRSVPIRELSSTAGHSSSATEATESLSPTHGLRTLHARPCLAPLLRSRGDASAPPQASSPSPSSLSIAFFLLICLTSASSCTSSSLPSAPSTV